MKYNKRKGNKMSKENRELAVISPRMMDIMEHYIGMLERENELLKNDYNVANDGIDDLNDALKDEKYYSEEYEKKAKAEIEELKAEIKELRAETEIDELQAFSKRLKDTSHYPKEYREEAEMYFHHNPNTEKLWFFMVGDSEVDEDGDIRTTLNVGVDAIAECDNLNGDVSVEVYK